MSTESRQHGVELPAPFPKRTVSLLEGPGTQAVLKRKLRLDRQGSPSLRTVEKGWALPGDQERRQEREGRPWIRILVERSGLD